MHEHTKTDGSESLFGEVIFSYTRAQAIADRVLIDVTPTALEAGFRFPTAVTGNLMAEIETTRRDTPMRTCKVVYGTCFGWPPSPLEERSRDALELPLS